MMKVLIVEDETIASGYLSDLLLRTEPDIRIAGVTEGIAQTVNWLRSNPAPDLIFMDIHLSDGSAFSIFDVATVETPIVFTTAYDEYAIKAFRVNSIDYLLKPVGEDDLRRALAKFRRLTALQRDEYLDRQSSSAYRGGYYKKLLVAHRDSLIPVPADRIAFFHTSGHQTSVCLSDGTAYPYNKPLDAIMRNLDPERFFRANKQFILSKEHVANITVWFDRRLLVTLTTDTPERIYVSKNKSTEFKTWITGYSG